MTSPDARRAAIGGATDVGAVRDENEDSYGLWGPEGGDWDFLIAVADGVGGHEHGKQASELALSAFFSALTGKSLPQSDAGTRSALSAAIVDANGAVFSAFSGTGTSRPGSTFTCVLARGGKSYIGHVGDSRAYMIHGGRIFQLSTDHTWVQLQVESGTMTAEEAAVSPYRNQVLKVLGAEPNVKPDVVVRPTAPGDLFIVCSDGVTEHVSVSQLLAESTTATSAEGLAKTLVALAVAQGGSDNATAVVAGVPIPASIKRLVGAKPETVEIPLLKQSGTPKGAAAATPASPTVPLPLGPNHTDSRRDWRPMLVAGLAVLFIVLLLILIGTRGHGDRPFPQTSRQAQTEGTPRPETPQTEGTPESTRVSDPTTARDVDAAFDRWHSAIESSDGKRLAQCYADRHLYNGRSCDRSRLLRLRPTTLSGVARYTVEGRWTQMIGADVEISFSYEMLRYVGDYYARYFVATGETVLRFRRVAGDWLIVEETERRAPERPARREYPLDSP
ncbi:protein phosphatase 2C domain-containing protein [bacterium]|nr:protein phosphatase 2C domain-containing protein [bacterium]